MRLRYERDTDLVKEFWFTLLYVENRNGFICFISLYLVARGTEIDRKSVV